MSATISNFLEALKKVDPARVTSRFPDERLAKEFFESRIEAQNLLEAIGPGGMSSFHLSQMEALNARLEKLIVKVDSSIELGARALTNQVVVWAEAHHLERAIYLAGQCSEKGIKEPFKTQIMLQPAHACMMRYRQIFLVREWITKNLQAAPPDELEIKIQSMLNALLDQFLYFSTQARSGNDKHVYAAYMYALAMLFCGYRELVSGNDEEHERLARLAVEVVGNISEPSLEDAPVVLRYHVKNYNEFKDFERLAERHPEVLRRLNFLHDKAVDLLDAGGGKDDSLHYWLSSYVGNGARAASVVGLVAASAGLFGVDADVALDAVNRIWDMAFEPIPELEVPTQSVENVNTTMAHTGGLTDKIYANVMMHTGGLV